MSVVQHNISAMNANRYFGINNSGLAKSLEKLSSGYAINRAGDNAAGLAVSEKMRSQIAGLTQGVKNAQDGISMIQTYEGALTETDSILQRMKTLATQSGNGTYQNDVDRDAIQLEFDQLNDELNQIADTDFNGVTALNGGTMADGTVVNNPGMVSRYPSVTWNQNGIGAGTLTYSENVNGYVDTAGTGAITVNGVNLKIKNGNTTKDVKYTDGTLTSLYKVEDLKVGTDGKVTSGKITATTDFKINPDTNKITINGETYTVSTSNLYNQKGEKVDKIHDAPVTVEKDDGHVKVAFEYSITDGVVKAKDGTTEVGRIEVSQGVSVSDAYNHGANNLTYANDITLQVGARGKDAVKFTFQYTSSGLGELAADMDCSARGLGTNQLNLRTQEDANAAIDKINNAINKVSMVRATFGAAQNRLEHKIDNMNVTKENMTSAESRIRDTNMAEEMTNFTKNQILSQASQAMLAQANQLPQGVLQLLG